MLKNIIAGIVIGGGILGSNAVLAEERMPDPFRYYSWVLEGAREVAKKNLEFAPVTSCFDLNRKFTGKQSTSIQKEREWEKYDGKLIPLTGVVEEVQKIPLLGDYIAHFKCTNSESFIQDFTVKIPKEMEEFAFDLSPGDKKNIVIRLTDYGEIMGVSGELDTFELDRGERNTCYAYLDWIERKTGNVEYKCYGANYVNGFGMFDKGYVGAYGSKGIDITFFITNKDPELFFGVTNTEEKEIMYTPGLEDNCMIVVEKDADGVPLEHQFDKSFSEMSEEDFKKHLLIESNGYKKTREGIEMYLEDINNIPDEKFSCEMKQALLYISYAMFNEEFAKEYFAPDNP